MCRVSLHLPTLFYHQRLEIEWWWFNHFWSWNTNESTDCSRVFFCFFFYLCCWSKHFLISVLFFVFFLLLCQWWNTRSSVGGDGWPCWRLRPWNTGDENGQKTGQNSRCSRPNARWHHHFVPNSGIVTPDLNISANDSLLNRIKEPAAHLPFLSSKFRYYPSQSIRKIWCPRLHLLFPNKRTDLIRAWKKRLLVLSQLFYFLLVGGVVWNSHSIWSLTFWDFGLCKEVAVEKGHRRVRGLRSTCSFYLAASVGSFPVVLGVWFIMDLIPRRRCFFFFFLFSFLLLFFDFYLFEEGNVAWIACRCI